MTTKETARYRKELRHAITNAYPHMDSLQIFNAMKKENEYVLFFEDLFEICQGANIPFNELKNIFASYQIFSKHLSKKNFIKFMEDEYSPMTTSPLPNTLTKEQKEILQCFVHVLLERRTQASPPSNKNLVYVHSLSSEKMLFSQHWIFAIKYNPPGSDDSRVRLAAFLKMIDEMNLPFSFDDFIDAIFNFFGQKIDSFDYDQFTRFIETFS